MQRDDSVPGAASPNGTAHRNLVERTALTVGSVSLGAAMAIDAAAVAGRHVGINLLGSIEIVQTCIVVAATSAIILATLSDSHARVAILLERMRRHFASRLLIATNIVSAFVFVWLAIGSGWLLADLWNGSERTELLHIPLRWIRLLGIFGIVLTAVLFVRQAFVRTTSDAA